jgi:hypothetical protein
MHDKDYNAGAITITPSGSQTAVLNTTLSGNNANTIGIGISTKTASVAPNETMTWSSNSIASSGTAGGIYAYALKATYTSSILTGSAASISSNCTVTQGGCADTSNVLSLNQQYASATGAVLGITNSGTGAGLLIQDASANAFLTVATTNFANGTGNYLSTNTVLRVAKDSGTGRSINAAGTINASNADYAEWIPWTGTKPTQGSVVQFHGMSMVVSSPETAAFVGNDQISSEDAILVAFAGQLPVKVTGTATAGDYLVPNGDGTARAVSPTTATLTDYVSRVATALENGTDTKVLALVSGPGSSNSFTTNPQSTPAFADLNITGTLTINNLVVTGNATFQGNIIVQGHIISAGNTPQVTTTIPGATVTVDGNDTAGTITLTLTTPTTSGGEAIDLNFHTPYTIAPKIALTADYALTATSTRYFTDGRTSSGFKVSTMGGLGAGVYKVVYQTIQ